MSTIAVINVLLWLSLVKKQSLTPWLISSGLYVLGCASRSFVPRSDIDRIVIFDHFFSSILVGRSIATIAELGFVAQWAFVLNILAKETKNKNVNFIAFIIFPLIFVAEIFSWYASLTTNTIGSVVEESIWGIVFLLITFCVVILRKYMEETVKNYASLVAIGLMIYVTYMFTIDVPFYYSKWQLDVKNLNTFDSLGEGLHNMMSVWKVSRLNKDWQYEFLWQGLYFSVGVWASLLLNFVPKRVKEIIKNTNCPTKLGEAIQNLSPDSRTF